MGRYAEVAAEGRHCRGKRGRWWWGEGGGGGDEEGLGEHEGGGDEEDGVKRTVDLGGEGGVGNVEECGDWC